MDGSGSETGRSESCNECGRRQPVKITKISTPVRKITGEPGSLSCTKRADALSSHVEEGGRSVMLDREHGQRSIPK